MELSLQMKQTQKLSPQMIQTLEILQMGNLELQEYVEKQLLENPMLDRGEQKEQESVDQLLRRMEWLRGDSRRMRGSGESKDTMMPLAVQPQTEGLQEHLRDQVAFKTLPRELRRAVEQVLAGLDSNGYLTESAEELAGRSGQPVQTVQRAVELVQELDPPGVGAHSLAECLELQLKRRGESGLVVRIVREHLEDMAKNHYNRIMQRTGASREAVQRACKLIRSLDPKPGSGFAAAEAPGYLIPDLLVTAKGESFAVTLNETVEPVLMVNPNYLKLLNESEDAQVREYLASKLRQAEWVTKGIAQRRSTLLRCGEGVVALQEDFFRKGPRHLRPMTLADVAGRLGLHESTVSRAIKDKYLQCSYGVFPMSSFFSRALQAASGEEITPERAKEAIRALIQEEDKKRPLSDQKLCELLAGQGLTLARRTVAKYREAMGILPAAGRREC